jgi:hypothetical protein
MKLCADALAREYNPPPYAHRNRHLERKFASQKMQIALSQTGTRLLR